MPIINYNDLSLGTTITFRTKNLSDIHQWIGIIDGFTKFKIVSTTQDLIPYDIEIRKNNPDLPPIEELRFLILTTRTDDTQQPNPLGVCAFEWIDLSTLQIIEDQHNVDIRVYDIGTRENELILLLKSHNFLVKKIS
jgi:hypothetical protein